MTTLSSPILSPTDQDRVVNNFINEYTTLLRLLERQASDSVVTHVDNLIEEINRAISPRSCFFSEENNAQLANCANSLATARKIYTGSLSENDLHQEAMCA